MSIINAEDDVLDDKGVIEALKEAKADVFETLNELTAERKLMVNMEKRVPPFKQVRSYYIFKSSLSFKQVRSFL